MKARKKGNIALGAPAGVNFPAHMGNGSLRSPRGRPRRTETNDTPAEPAQPATDEADAEAEAPATRRRRPSDPALLRSILFPTYWTRAERTRLGELAKEWSMPVSAYVRMVALSKQLPPRRPARPPVPAVNAELYVQFAGVANNLNQLARRMNTGGGEEPTAIEVLDTIDALLPIVRRIQQELIGTSPAAVERGES
jgi:hypothetical protein